MKIVIIGYTGFIGSNIFKYLKNKSNYDFILVSTKEIDLIKKESVKKLSKCITNDCIVIMCAGIKKQLGDNLDVYDGNNAIINNFCRSVVLSSPKKVIFFSSASVYGEDVAYVEKITEKTPVKPKSFYGVSKFTSELLLERICKDNNIQLVILWF